MTTHEIWVVAGLVVVFAVSFLLWRFVFVPQDLSGPVSTIVPAVDDRAGEYQEWDDLDADTQAEQLISEWHAGEELDERTALVEDHVTAWLDDPDLIVWDAKQQAARCWEILHIEFPRLRAELGIAA